MLNAPIAAKDGSKNPPYQSGNIFSQPPLLSFQRDKNVGNFLVRGSFQTNDQPGTFQMHSLTMQNFSFHSQRKENVGIQEIH